MAEQTDDAPKEEGTQSVDNAQVLDALGKLNDGLGKLPGFIAQAVQSSIPKAEEREEEDQEEDQDKGDRLPTLADQELDRLPRRDFAALIARQINSEVVKPLREEMKTLRGGIDEVSIEGEKERIGREVRALQEKDPEEFDALKGDMAKILKQFPSLSVGDAMTLARANNPGALEPIEKKREETRAKEDKEKEESQPFVGFFPTSTSNTRTESDRKGRLSMSEASAKAFDEWFGAGTQNIG